MEKLMMMESMKLMIVSKMMIATQDCGELTPTLERQVLPISRPTQAKDKVRGYHRL